MIASSNRISFKQEIYLTVSMRFDCFIKLCCGFICCTEIVRQDVTDSQHFFRITSKKQSDVTFLSLVFYQGYLKLLVWKGSITEKLIIEILQYANIIFLFHLMSFVSRLCRLCWDHARSIPSPYLTLARTVPNFGFRPCPNLYLT